MTDDTRKKSKWPPAGRQSDAPAKIQMERALAGPLFMLSAAVLFTLLTILIKLMGPAYSVWHIGFFRCFGGAVVLLALFGRRKNPYQGYNVPLLILRGGTGSIAFVCLVSALRMLPVSTAMVIFYSFPAFSALFSFWLHDERIGRMEMVCMAIVLGGVAILFDFELSGNLWGRILALAGGAFAGLTVTLIRSLRAHNGPVIIYLYFCTMGTLVTTPFFLAQPVWPATPVEWAMVLGIVFSSVTAQLLMNQGFFYCRGWEGGVLMSGEVVLTALIGILFLGDPVSWRFWIGGVLIFGSVVTLNRLKAGTK